MIGGRDKQRNETAVEKLKLLTGSQNIYWEQCDLASLKSVQKFAETVLKKEKQIDILINNAGL